jgi:hypothetical protein
VVLYPGSKMQKSIDEGTAIVVSVSDPAQANQEAHQWRLNLQRIDVRGEVGNGARAGRTIATTNRGG